MSVAWPWNSARRLMDHDARVGQRETLVLGAGGQQERAHGRRLPHAKCGHWRPYELHGVVNCHTRSHHSARRIDVHRDFFFRVLGLQKQKLRYHKGRNSVLDWPGDEDDSLLQKPRINVIGPLATVGLFDHHGHQIVHVGIEELRFRLLDANYSR